MNHKSVFSFTLPAFSRGGRSGYLACADWRGVGAASLPWMDMAPAGIADTSPCGSMFQLFAIRFPPAVRQKNAAISMISALL